MQELLMHRTVRGLRLSLVFAGILLSTTSGLAQTSDSKLGRLAKERADRGVGWSRVIIQAAESAPLADLDSLIHAGGGVSGQNLSIIHARTAYMPDAALRALSDHPLVARVMVDRLVQGVNERTSTTTGATAIRQELGYDGTGIGVAIIDSGVALSHDDLGGATGQRIVRF